jgi:hypothetical protein
MKEPAQIPILFFLIKKYINSVYKLIVHEGFIMEGKGTINKKLKEKALIGVLLLLSAIPISLANQPQRSDPISTDAFQNTNHENHIYTGPAKTILDSPNGMPSHEDVCIGRWHVLYLAPYSLSFNSPERRGRSGKSPFFRAGMNAGSYVLLFVNL